MIKWWGFPNISITKHGSILDDDMKTKKMRIRVQTIQRQHKNIFRKNCIVNSSMSTKNSYWIYYSYLNGIYRYDPYNFWVKIPSHLITAHQNQFNLSSTPKSILFIHHYTVCPTAINASRQDIREKIDQYLIPLLFQLHFFHFSSFSIIYFWCATLFISPPFSALIFSFNCIFTTVNDMEYRRNDTQGHLISSHYSILTQRISYAVLHARKANNNTAKCNIPTLSSCSLLCSIFRDFSPLFSPFPPSVRFLYPNFLHSFSFSMYWK